MYDDQVTVPLVVRTPMGGRRGYGPTHSQSLEKLLLGIPNICVVAASECHDLRGLLTSAVEDEQPVFFIENKLMYGRVNRRPEDGQVGQLSVRESGGPYPALTFSGTDFTEASATIATYGGMVPVVLDAVTELILEHEIFCEVVALSQLLPMELDAVLESSPAAGSSRPRRARSREGSEPRSRRACRRRRRAISVRRSGASRHATGSSRRLVRSRTRCSPLHTTSWRRSPRSKA